jgi:hypothetical protein
MKTTVITHNWRTFLIRSAVSRAARLSIFGLIGWTLFLSSSDVACKAVLVGAVFGLAVLVGVTWYSSRARARGRADRRWRIALDHYAQKELDRYLKQAQAKRTHSGGRLT